MAKVMDLTGQKINHWTVISRDENKGKYKMWLCECDCENKTQRSVNEQSLTRGLSKSCGCTQENKLVGIKFGKLTVLELVGKNKHGVKLWLCECECENKTRKVINGRALIQGHTKSCGCLQGNIKHGLAKKRQYSIYGHMKGRCLNPNNPKYKDYGGRGITICDEWLDQDNGFINFYNWSNENGYSEELSIDRIDVNGNYEPSNCRWATDEIQANNKRNNVYVNIDGEMRATRELEVENKLPRNLILQRLARGWTGDDLLIPALKPKAERQSKEKGISWDKKSNKWIVKITEEGKRIRLGCYTDEEEAIRVKYTYLNETFNI